MLGRLAELGPDDRFDCCIIGTGPAGTTLALSLADAGFRVALLEGGERDWSDWSQALYQGEVVGDPFYKLDEGRLRYFGGTSNHWAGWCRPLDESDFEAGPSGDHAWPIERSDIDTYLEPASEILEIDELPPDRPIPGAGLKQVRFRFSPPVQFATKYGPALESHGRIFLAFEASLTGFDTNGSDIIAARAVDKSGDARQVQAAAYVLATGGIENSRLLLWSNAQAGGRIVKDARTLGKYWMEHPTFTLGDAVLTDDLAFSLNQFDVAFFSPTPEAMREDGIFNCGLRFHRLEYRGTQKLIADIACVAPDLGRWMLNRLGSELICGAYVRAAWEQEPRAENRIELADERDALGMPRPKLYWTKSETDFHTVRKAAERLGKYLAEANIGRLRLRPWVPGPSDPPSDDEIGGRHHMGGTRMADTADKGIVDRNSKVFGQSNLYVAGSSVFPRCGHANPTLTIVQLALRLAAHLRTVL